MRNPLLALPERKFAVPSYCTANELVIEALLEQGKNFDTPILIEGTANQINQFGGYTGMKPADFRDYVFAIADRVNFPHEKVFLGGDHMGPLVWSNLPEKEAMSNSRELLRLCILAGFKKIHLDTSMKLADDDPDARLSDEVIAERGVILLEECEKTYQEMLKANPDEIRPVYVIGSEVPIPGGSQDETEDEDRLQVTRVEDFEKTLEIYKQKFSEHGISDLWNDVIGVVVQPGVEFGDKDIHFYNRDKARELCASLNRHTNVIFEGHSTDYQPAEKLHEMAQDGVAILKVGPALTFALRQGLFALSMIEREFIDEDKRANFIETLERVMLENPANWIKHYHGSDHDKFIARKYSYSDRCRYYFSLPEIKAAITKLFANIDSVIDKIPAGMLKQFMPRQYFRVRDGIIQMKAAVLVKDCLNEIADDYNYAVKI